ncbi:zinc-finger domain-containing protein [Coxiella burnetii]|uniref:zinc-finger domain-containing protein n=1 Tax=Coxiella burnetii TaxID=777 RepID=UPI0021768451|nr:zinc-finger domain-containing protein [Coxiella burnetii]
MMKKPRACCIKRYYEVTEADLPLSCPMPQDRLWDAHPRVYLPIERERQVTCSYCEAKYILKDFKESAA